jgi:hypothetical protein
MFLPGIAMVRKQGDMGKTKEGNPVPFMVRWQCEAWELQPQRSREQTALDPVAVSVAPPSS